MTSTQLCCQHLYPTRQSGAALLITLMMLMVLMLLGTSAAQMTLMNEKSSRNLRDRQIAFEAAEAALTDASYDIFTLRKASTTTDLFPVVAGTCGQRSNQQGLCLPRPDAPLWQSIDLAATTTTVAYGQFSGRVFSGAMTSLTKPIAPRYLIELIRFKNPDVTAKSIERYRITAIGFASNPNTQLVLQAVFDSASGKRLSWREISNWQELHNGTVVSTEMNNNDNNEPHPLDIDELQ